MQKTLLIINTLLLVALLTVSLRRSTIKIKETGKTRKKLVLDTCALIDGRILEITETGFLSPELIIPNYIIDELQLLADGQDSHKRERARYGLDIVQALQKSPNCLTQIYEDDNDRNQPTDTRLVSTAKRLSADLCTIDYNLNKVATIGGVKVLNVNELANAIRPVALPGEKRFVKIVQKGSNKNQGVGYADDGSMIVVEGAEKMIGKTVEVEVSRYIQTDAGKMLFAKPASNNAGKNTRSNKTSAPPR